LKVAKKSKEEGKHGDFSRCERGGGKKTIKNQWRTEGGWGVQTPLPPEIPKAIQNRAKLNPIVKTVKNCRI